MGLQLLAMLFCRPTELREAKWQEFDLEQGLWNIPAERMKKRREHIVPLEPLVAEFYSMHTNYKVRRVNAVLQHPDPDKHFMLANLDYSVVGDADVQILECKTAGEYGAKL